MSRKFHVKKPYTPQKSGRFIGKMSKDEIIHATEEYLSGKREEVLGKLAALLNQPNLNKVRPILKKGIHDYVKHYYRDFEGSIEIKSCVYDMFSNFNMTDFVERTWQYKPYYITAADYERLRTVSKNPVHIVNYDYTKPLYKLANSIEYNPNYLKLHRNKEKIKNDVQFYVTKDEDTVCAKIVSLRYSPSDLRAVKKFNKDKSAEEREFAVYDNYLYNRSLSISMYVLLDGDPKKAMPYFRYDNDPTPHSNVYIGDDKRREIYGDIALNPHFHFQNEDDSLLCLRKFEGEDGRIKYNTGRCNAIDCKHLKKYLLDLDNMTQNEVQRKVEQNLHYNMPFLHLRAKNKKIGVTIDNLFYNFIKDKTDEEMLMLEEIGIWLTHSKNAKIYNRGKCFDKLVRGLDFLDRLTTIMDNSISCEQRKLYSQLEIIAADAIVNVIGNNNQMYVVQNQTPKFSIETDLLEKDDD